jgi:putative tricarboxylic transport membrane protein
MQLDRLRPALPYVAGLIIAAALYQWAGRIAYTPRGNELGPDVWPKLAIGLLAAACLAEIVRILFRGKGGTAVAAEPAEPAEETEPPRQTRALIGGILLILAYAVLVPVLGFLLATLLFMVAFMYHAGYRAHAAIWGVSVSATVVIALLFQRFAYLSLPRGIPPFDGFTDLIRIMLGG